MSYHQMIAYLGCVYTYAYYSSKCGYEKMKHGQDIDCSFQKIPYFYHCKYKKESSNESSLLNRSNYQDLIHNLI